MAEKQLVLYYREAEFVTRFAAYLEKKSALPVRCQKGFSLVDRGAAAVCIEQ